MASTLKRVLRTKQRGVLGCAAEALSAAETAEAEQGQRSVFCESAATLEAKAGHRNPEQRSNFHRGALPPAGKIG